MNKIKWFLLLSLIITFLTFGASADVIPIEQNTAYEYPRTFLLRSGDLLHCLTISYERDVIDRDDWTYLYLMDAVCHELQDGAFVPCQSHCADRWSQDRVVPEAEMPRRDTMNGMTVSAQNETFLIDAGDVVYRWTPGEADPWQYQCTLDMSQVPYEFIAAEEYYAEDGVLYACYAEITDTGYIGEGTAFSFSLETGACKKICAMPTLYEIYPAGENRMLVGGNPVRSGGASNYFYNVVTEKTSELAGNRPLDRLMSDGRGGWYCAGWDALYHLNEDGEQETVVQLSPGNTARYISLSNDKKTAYFYSDSCLYVYPLDANDADKDLTLVLAGSLNEYGYMNGSLPDLAEFYAENPGVQIETINYPSSFEDLALELLSGSDKFDLMVMECSSGSLQSLLDKGFYVDLSDDGGIVSLMENLYPIWRKPCTHGDDIAAVPIGARSVWTFMYNQEIWEEEHLGPIPTTYDEFFDCIEDWDNQGILDTYPLFQQSGTSFGRLLHRIMVDYTGKCKREGTPIVFENETLLHLLNRLEELRPILQAHDTRNVTGDILLSESILTDIVHVNDERTLIQEPMPLGLTDARDCTESVFYTVLIVNPKSTRIDLAKAYLSYLAQHPSAWARCVLLQGAPNGVREKGYEDATEQYEQLMPDLNEKIEVALRDHDDAVAQELERQKDALTSDYLNQWEVKPRMTDMLYQVLPHFAVLTSDGYGFLQGNGADLMDMFSAGQIDCQTLVKRLDQRKQMMILEGIE